MPLRAPASASQGGSGYNPDPHGTATFIKMKSWDGELSERQVEDYTYVAIEALCALGEVGCSRTALDIHEMAAALHPEIVVDGSILHRVLELGLVKGRFERAVDFPDGFSIHKKLHLAVGPNQKYYAFLTQIVDVAQQRAEEIRQRNRMGERSAFANGPEVVPFSRVAPPRTSNSAAPVGNPFLKAGRVDPLLAKLRGMSEKDCVLPAPEPPAFRRSIRESASSEETTNEGAAAPRRRAPAILAGGQAPAFKLTLPSFQASGQPASGESHYEVETEQRELRAPRLEATGNKKFAQQYTLGGVGGIRAPDALFTQKALDANDLANLAVRHGLSDSDRYRPAVSYTRVQY